MTTSTAVGAGARFIAGASGRLRKALLVKPAPAIERAVPQPGEPGVLYATALQQHEVLCNTLRFFGVETVLFDPHSQDGCEVAAADAAVLFAGGAVPMRPTTMARRAEADRMESEFSQLDVPLIGTIAAPGLLDGGDVVLAGQTAFVGVGSRGNGLGRAEFAKLASANGYAVVEVKLDPRAPSLRSVLSAVARDTLVVAAGMVDVSALAGFTCVTIDAGEDFAAGVLVLGERRVLADMRYRTSLRAMRKAKISVESLDLYEFTKIGITPSMLVLALKRD